jgi:two-component system chemotaxis sensor kinase CheA
LCREPNSRQRVIDRLAQEMQSAIMALRLQPASEAFDRFPRLVRDLARKLSKKIDLQMEGEETSADKSIIAGLGEPLLRIHGIETPEDRITASKSSQAHILMRA